MRSIKLAVIAFFLAAVPAALAYSSGPPAAHTGAPGELTCRECHASFALNQEPGELELEGVPAVYEPGRAYTVTVRLTHPQRQRWGFQVAAFTDALENGGTLSVTDTTHTKRVVSGARAYIEHTTIGTYAGQGGGASWTLRWTAPAAAAGTVTFYAAGNAANGNATDTGDNIYTTVAESRPPEAAPAFADVTAAAGLDPAAGGDGFAWADFDGDGDFDVFVARPGRGLLYRDDDGRFVEAGAASGLAGATDATAAAWGDADNDGRPDLALATPAGVRLFRNGGSGFAEASAGLPSGAAARAVAWADYDGDGDLDLLAALASGLELMRNGGDGAFAEAAGLGLEAAGPADALAWADFDGDGRLGVFVAAPTKGMLFEYGPEDGFELIGSEAVAGAAGGRGAAWADYDGDGDLDLFVAGEAALRLLRNDGGDFTDVTAAAGLAGVSGRALALDDLDGDGRPDLLVTGAAGDRLLRFDGAVFAEAADRLGLPDVDGRAAAIADYDADGRADVLLLAAAGLGLWESPSSRAGLTVRAVTDGDNDATDAETASDRDALAATVAFDGDGDFGAGPRQARVIDGGGSSAQAPPRAFFGGGAGTVFARALFADGEGRQGAASAGGTLVLRDARAAAITSVSVKTKNGTDKLNVEGERFVTGSERIEVDGERMDSTKYKKPRPGGTSAKLVGTDAAFGALVPAGRPVLVTTFDPASGARSAPFEFER